jgi:hypothetical protein
LQLGFDEQINITPLARIVGTRTKQTDLRQWLKALTGSLNENLALKRGKTHPNIMRSDQIAALSKTPGFSPANPTGKPLHPRKTTLSL